MFNLISMIQAESNLIGSFNCVNYIKVVCMKGQFHCLVWWSMRSPTFSVFVSSRPERGGGGGGVVGACSHLWQLTSILCPLPICHFDPSRMRSLADSRLRQTKEGLCPNSVSINEQCGKYRALYTIESEY